MDSFAGLRVPPPGGSTQAPPPPQLPQQPPSAQPPGPYHSQDPDRWTPLGGRTSPSYLPSTSPAPSSVNSSFTVAADDSQESPFGYPSHVGLGISPQPPGVHRAVSSEALLQESPRIPDTPKTPHYQPSDSLLGSPGPLKNPMQAEYLPYGGGAQSPPPAPRRRGERWSCRWNWEWTDAPWIMYLLLLVGVIMAVGHHVFYSRLRGKPAEDQLKMMRFGTLMAYVAKSSLVSAVIFAYRQQIWATVRRKNLKLRTIDNLFAAADDLRAMASWELLKKARVALSLALVVWFVLPLLSWGGLY